MLNLLSFSEVILFAIISKMEPDSFKRLFRSNEAMNRFITQTRRRFNIRVVGQLKLEQTYADRIFLEFKEKHYFECGYEENYSVAWMRDRFRNALGYFRYELIILELIDNKFFEEFFPISAVKLRMVCDKNLTAAADVIRPESLELSPPENGRIHGISQGVLERLNLASVFFDEQDRSGGAKETLDLFTSLVPHVEYKIQFRLSGKHFFGLGDALTAAVQAVVSDASQCQDIQIIKKLDTFYRLGESVPNIQHHPEYNTYKIGASNVEAWSIGLEECVVLITEHVSRNKKHHIHVTTLVDIGEFREFHNENLKAAVKIGSRGARRALNIQQIWDRVSGEGLRRSSTPVDS